jgi:hypothetical protein
VSLALTFMDILLMDRPDLPANSHVPATSNRRVLVRPPRARYTQPAPVATPQVPEINQ